MSTTIHFMFNMQPHYHHATFVNAPYDSAITVKVILDEAYRVHKSTHVYFGEPECPREKFQLRYITGEINRFSVSPNVDQNSVREDALSWYKNKGYSLDSTCIGPDESTLVKSVVGMPDTGVVRLYVITAADITPTLSTAKAPPLLAKRRKYVEELQASLASGGATSSPKDDESIPYWRLPSYCHPHPNFGPWAAFHEPVFAYAKTTLKGLLPIYPELRPLDKNLEVLDGKAFDIRLCSYDMGKILQEVKDTPNNTCIKALARLLRDLFDDPSLEVNARHVIDKGHLSTELDIRGECRTAHGLPALYIMGRETLRPGYWAEREVKGFVEYKHAVVGSKYCAVREMTCCPCLIFATEQWSINIYAAYFSDMPYRDLLCEIPLLGPYDRVPSGEYSNMYKFQVIRKTAQQLRRAYASVHTGSAISNAPHLFPSHAKLSIPRLPFKLDLLDRVPLSSSPSFPKVPSSTWAPLLFTGLMSCDDRVPISVHVKFIADREYGLGAHRLLARHQVEGKPMPLAPVFTHRHMLPDMQMIVMETLRGDTLEHLLASGATVSEEELKDVHTAVRLLHRHGFVHGKIRPSNVIVQRPAPGKPEGTTRAFLVDFDWAGKAGKVNYPNMLNEHVRWPRPARELAGKPITKRHDLFMLKHLLSPPRVKTEDDASTMADGGPEAYDLEIIGEEPEEMDGEVPASDAADNDAVRRDALWSHLGVLKGGKAEDFGRTWRDRYGPVYPENINPKIRWPRPAEELRCQPITPAHDQFMLQEMLRQMQEEEDDGEEEYEDPAEDGSDDEDADVIQRTLGSDGTGPWRAY